MTHSSPSTTAVVDIPATSEPIPGSVSASAPQCSCPSMYGARKRICCSCVPCERIDRKSTRLNSSHTVISYAVFCLKKKKKTEETLSTVYIYSDYHRLEARHERSTYTEFSKAAPFSSGAYAGERLYDRRVCDNVMTP